MLLNGGIYIDILTIIIIFPTPLVIALFLAAASLLLCHLKNVFHIYIQIKVRLCDFFSNSFHIAIVILIKLVFLHYILAIFL